MAKAITLIEVLSTGKRPVVKDSDKDEFSTIRK